METLNDWWNFIMQALCIVWFITGTTAAIMMIGGCVYYGIKAIF